jgi:uridylate kinase
MMNSMKSETIVISVGGSLIVPGKGDGTPDARFLNALRMFIKNGVESGRRFVCIAGGGKTARLYQNALDGIVETDAVDEDWIGIHATRLNGQLLKIALKEYADDFLVTNPDELPETDMPVIVGGGYRPGASTDLRAVQIAKNLGATRVVNLSNIDYAYTDDPNKNPNAQKIERMSWDEFISLIPSEWSPGLSSPFDPIASREAKIAGIEVAIINGNKLEEVEKYLNTEPFIGSVIR